MLPSFKMPSRHKAAKATIHGCLCKTTKDSLSEWGNPKSGYWAQYQRKDKSILLQSTEPCKMFSRNWAHSSKDLGDGWECWESGSQSVVHEPTASASFRDVLGMQILRPCPKSADSEMLGMWPSSWCLNSPFTWFWTLWSVRTADLEFKARYAYLGKSGANRQKRKARNATQQR